jgi:hypothetical protein
MFGHLQVGRRLLPVDAIERWVAEKQRKAEDDIAMGRVPGL